MYIKLFEQLKTAQNLQQDKIDYFYTRMNNHINLVQGAARKIVQCYPQYQQLLDQVRFHDASKYLEPELSPYIEMTWNRKEDLKAEPDLQKKITQATLHHIKNNSHHPEYHLEDKTEVDLNYVNRDDCPKCITAYTMGDIDIAEMVADWQAMSEELGTNTSREWYDSVKDVRWSFTDVQDKLIDKLLKVFEN